MAALMPGPSLRAPLPHNALGVDAIMFFEDHLYFGILALYMQ